MNTVTGPEMSRFMLRKGADAVLHRYQSVADQESHFMEGQAHGKTPWVAIGAAGDYQHRAKVLRFAGAFKFCVDVANGHSRHCIQATKWLRDEFGSDVDIMAGNVCTAEATTALIQAGANVIRVGIGAGSSCITRLVTGHGLPQLTAIQAACSPAGRWPSVNYPIHVIADGGIRSSGDIVKALAAGADAVMIGGLLAGTSYTPGEEKTNINGEHYKEYSGMASEAARKNWFDSENTSYVPEGVSFRVPYRGSSDQVIDRLVGGLKVGMSFSNALTLDELRENALFRRVTPSGRKEANPNEKLFR
jgi:IMP dehydrogenase